MQTAQTENSSILGNRPKLRAVVPTLKRTKSDLKKIVSEEIQRDPTPISLDEARKEVYDVLGEKKEHPQIAWIKKTFQKKGESVSNFLTLDKTMSKDLKQLIEERKKQSISLEDELRKWEENIPTEKANNEYKKLQKALKENDIPNNYIYLPSFKISEIRKPIRRKVAIRQGWEMKQRGIE